MLRCGQLLENTWEVIGLIGTGTFSELYVAANIFTEEYVAVKVQNKDYKGSILKVAYLLAKDNSNKLSRKAQCCKLWPLLLTLLNAYITAHNPSITLS